APRTWLADNRSRANRNGFALDGGSSGSTLVRNLAPGNAGFGFFIASSENLVEANVAVGNLASIGYGGGFTFQQSRGNRVRNNVANENGTPANGPGFEL